MSSTLKLLPKLALIGGLALSLGFGASEALACSACPPPATACANEQNPSAFCDSYCSNAGCVTGDCNIPADECVCVE